MVRRYGAPIVRVNMVLYQSVEGGRQVDSEGTINCHHVQEIKDPFSPLVNKFFLF